VFCLGKNLLEDKLEAKSIIRHFRFSRYITFIMYLYIMYVQLHSKNYYVSRKDNTSYNLEERQYLCLYSLFVYFLISQHAQRYYVITIWLR
jgi:hypothetical protein